jgi:two-component system phosphate regulon sensor histidine kinase PhoR
VRRSLIVRLFFNVLAALVVGAGLLTVALGSEVRRSPSLGLLALAAALLLAGVAAWIMTRSVQRGLAPLERLAQAFPEQPAGARDARGLRVFDRVAEALEAASSSARGALARAAESRRELEALLDSMQDPVVAVDAAGRIQWTNRAMQAFLPDYSASGALRIGHALVQTIRDPEVLECVRAALETRSVGQRRTTTLLPGRIFEVNASPMPGGGAVAVLHDITRIEQVERTQRDFVANVSHELRTPLTSISGYVETLLDHETLTPVAREFLTTILKNANRMQRLTDDLLSMTRAESRESELYPKAVSAEELVRDATESMRGLVQDAGAVLEIGETTTAEVLADADSVVQVLGNLIENGIKYGNTRGSGRTRVVVSARVAPGALELPGAVEFSVRDFGQGIASEHLTRIFERFYRVDKARSRESGGTGLGLAIAKHVVEMQGGAIRAESTLGQGSEFLVYLPRVPREPV